MVNPQASYRIEKPFLDAVRTTLGDRYTDNVDVIYQATIKFIIDSLQAGFDKAEGNPEMVNRPPPAHIEDIS
ncbi:hypothetical protein B566_EDAN001909 [Ephemera danica]|nr:hypothetical protein B566_EDAN001909 [Ephemera danica]